jgi:hypothetical protein
MARFILPYALGHIRSLIILCTAERYIPANITVKLPRKGCTGRVGGAACEAYLPRIGK